MKATTLNRALAVRQQRERYALTSQERDNREPETRHLTHRCKIFTSKNGWALGPDGVANRVPTRRGGSRSRELLPGIFYCQLGIRINNLKRNLYSMYDSFRKRKRRYLIYGDCWITPNKNIEACAHVCTYIYTEYMTYIIWYICILQIWHALGIRVHIYYLHMYGYIYVPTCSDSPYIHT